EESDKPSLFSRVQTFFQKKQQSDDARFNDVYQAVELCAKEQQTTADTVSALSQQISEVTALKQKQTELETRLNDLTTQLSQQDRQLNQRPLSQGSQNAATEHLTNC
ncbi:GPO family capsid scaffolding protein, partial [Xenorhabdus bovienii]